MIFLRNADAIINYFNDYVGILIVTLHHHFLIESSIELLFFFFDGIFGVVVEYYHHLLKFIGIAKDFGDVFVKIEIDPDMRIGKFYPRQRKGIFDVGVDVEPLGDLFELPS